MLLKNSEAQSSKLWVLFSILRDYKFPLPRIKDKVIPKQITM